MAILKYYGIEIIESIMEKVLNTPLKASIRPTVTKKPGL